MAKATTAKKTTSTSKRTAPKGAAKGTQAKKSPEGMKAQQLIAVALKHNPDFSPADGAQWIKDTYGVEVKVPYFQVTKSKINTGKISEDGYAIEGTSPSAGKSTGKGRGRGRRPGSKNKSRSVSNGTSIDLSVLQKAKAFADNFETWEEAENALNTVGELLEQAGGLAEARTAFDAVYGLQPTAE